MHWLLAGYMWLYIHRPFEVWPGLAELRFERVYMLVMLACWAMSSRRRWTSNRIHGALAALLGAVAVAWLASPYQDRGWLVVEDLLKIGVFYVLVVSTISDERRFRFVVGSFLACMALYMGHSLLEYQNGRVAYRMETERMIGVDIAYGDPNTFAASCLYALPMVVPFWRTARTRQRKMLLLGYAALSATCILLTGSRTALIGLFALVAIATFVSRYRLRIVVALVTLGPIVWSLLPADRQQRYLTIVNPSFGPKTALDSAESRETFLLMAYELWTQKPLFGYGPSSFAMVSGTGLEVHSLYGQLLAELGLFGIIAFAAVLCCFVANAKDISRASRGIPWRERSFAFWVSTSVLASVVLMLVMGFGGHNLFRYTWAWFGAFQAIAVGLARRATTVAESREARLSWPAGFGAIPSAGRLGRFDGVA